MSTRVQKKNPKDRTPPFKRLTCLIWSFQRISRTRSPTTRVGHAGWMWGQPWNSEAALLWRAPRGGGSLTWAAQSLWSVLIGGLPQRFYEPQRQSSCLVSEKKSTMSGPTTDLSPCLQRPKRVHCATASFLTVCAAAIIHQCAVATTVCMFDVHVT